MGVFVTLMKNNRLRGCIGRFEPSTPLFQTIQQMTVEAATCDPRFDSVRYEEIKDIMIEISVMSPKKRIKNWKEVKLGVHGVLIQNGNKSATFLPQVATDTNWTLEEFLGNLCQMKGGLPFDCYKDKNTNIYTYTVQIIHD